MRLDSMWSYMSYLEAYLIDYILHVENATTQQNIKNWHLASKDFVGPFFKNGAWQHSIVRSELT
jgi:hypothetical protein